MLPSRHPMIFAFWLAVFLALIAFVCWMFKRLPGKSDLSNMNKVVERKTTTSELVLFLLCVVSLYPIYTILKYSGFDEYQIRNLLLAYVFAFFLAALTAGYWFMMRRTRKRIENWQREFEKLSLEEQASCLEGKRTPFDRYIEERIRQGDLTREQWNEMESQARSLGYSPEIARQNSIRMRKKVKRLSLALILFLIVMITIYVIRGLFP